jgi:hypothetical protein
MKQLVVQGDDMKLVILVKGKRGHVGEQRTWGGKLYEKTSKGWRPVKSRDKTAVGTSRYSEADLPAIDRKQHDLIDQLDEVRFALNHKRKQLNVQNADWKTRAHPADVRELEGYEKKMKTLKGRLKVVEQKMKKKK